jgi:4-hydroxy-tetrahydrodipicolinate reductase
VINVCIAGATGWAGRGLLAAVAASEDLALRAAVARGAAGSDLGVALGGEPMGVTVRASVAEALDGAADVHVLVDYTSHAAVRGNTLAALERGVAVVIGSSGLGADDFAEIDATARRAGVGVIAAGNFSLTAAMAQAAAVLVARFLPDAEIIDYASATKPDAPSGTARELAERLGEVRLTAPAVPIVETAGAREARGTTISGTQVHSLRLPSFSASTEVIFGLADERLSIRHDAGMSADPYVAGTLLAVRRVGGRAGLLRGLDRLLLEEA